MIRIPVPSRAVAPPGIALHGDARSGFYYVLRLAQESPPPSDRDLGLQPLAEQMDPDELLHDDDGLDHSTAAPYTSREDPRTTRATQGS